MTNRQVKLESNDKQIFDISSQIAEQSGTIKRLMEHCDMGEDVAIPLLNVDSTILKKIIEWMTHHKDDIPSFDEDDYGERKKLNIPKWDQDFLEVDQSTLLQMLLAANYLDIPNLINFICKIIADMLNGKSPEEIRTKFNIINDFTPEEEEALRKEYESLNDK